VEGTIRHPAAGEAWEYSIVVSILGGQGQEITRQIVSVGALNPEEARTFRMAVEVFTPSSEEASKER
jgi:polyhydroxyalkanoate synthesis regulator phasin